MFHETHHHHEFEQKCTLSLITIHTRILWFRNRSRGALTLIPFWGFYQSEGRNGVIVIPTGSPASPASGFGPRTLGSLVRGTHAHGSRILGPCTVQKRCANVAVDFAHLVFAIVL